MHTSVLAIARGARGAALGLALIAAVPAAAQEGGPPPAQVGTVALERTAAPMVVTLPGRAVAYQQVEIRPRAGGVIEEILYTPGARVTAGTPLFRLDDAALRAAAAAAAAELATAEAALSEAQSSYNRAQKLEGSGYSEAQVESVRTTLAQAQAAADGARAALDFAQTELSWAVIRSPIDGVVEVADVSVGDLATAAQADPLTIVTRLDPIDVDMLETSARMLSIRRQMDDGLLKMSDTLEASLTLEDGRTYQATGRMVTPAATVSTSTGAFQVRFRFDNPDRRILPGMFLRGVVRLGEVEAFLVPQRAAQRDKAGRLSVLIAKDGVAERVEIEETGVHDNAWIVPEGLSEGDMLIVDGLKSLRAGAKVAPVPATVGANGLVRDLGQDGN
ncbi:efflux RND transporter periplasmic adaptor subunit [Rhodovulum sp. DZ06]|uniref:efflux RND transporter periplasmic adaptor subunit n=1 Tax=Rhodovulum sp. DZ06 TaxID=3425126 RepID=UPI003D32E2AA